MPQDPFVAGKVFEKWVKAETDENGAITGLTETVVTGETVINENLTVVAVFRKVDVYRVTAHFWYRSDAGETLTIDGESVKGHIFETQIHEFDSEEAPPPYTID